MAATLIGAAENSLPAVFVTRHPGALEWAARRGLCAVPVAHLIPARLRSNQIVIGTLPADVAAEVCARGGRYYHLTLRLGPNDRGRELSADEMEALGARLVEVRCAFVGNAAGEPIRSHGHCHERQHRTDCESPVGRTEPSSG